MAEMRLEGATRRFGDTVAVDRMDLAVADGEFVVLLGPTGAGKTTTLRLVAGLERADAGRVFIGGREVTALAPAQRDVTFVFQQYSLYPHLSVFDNLAFPLRSPARRTPRETVRRRVTEVAEMLRIDHKLANRATQLSGGEMQRVAIGRALVREPAVFLMDEPLSSLDAKLRSDLRLELKRIQQELGATILYVTHDQIEAMTMANRIGVLAEGRLIQIGTPREIYRDPATTYVATRLGQPAINLIPHDLLPCPGMPPGTRTIGARTEHLRVRPVGAARRSAQGSAQGSAGTGLRGRIDWVEHLGDQSYLHLAVADRHLVTLADPADAPERGAEVEIGLIDPLFFDVEGRRLPAGNGMQG